MAIPVELREQAVKVFRAYERAVVVRLLKRREGKLDPDPLEKALATGDSDKVRAFISKFDRAYHEILHSVIV